MKTHLKWFMIKKCISRLFYIPYYRPNDLLSIESWRHTELTFKHFGISEILEFFMKSFNKLLQLFSIKPLLKSMIKMGLSK